MGQPGAVPLGALGPLQGSCHVTGGEGGPIGEQDAGSESENVGKSSRIIGVALTQPGLGLHLRVQLEQPFVQKSTDHLLHAVGTGDGIQGLVRTVRQREGEGQQYLRLFLLNGVLQQLFRYQGTACVVRLLLPTAGQRQQEQSGTQQR